MERRDFIRRVCSTCAAGIGAAWWLQSCTTQRYIEGVTTNLNTIRISKSEFEKAEDIGAPIENFLLLKNSNFDYPIIIYKLNDKEYKAHLLQCTHQGCELQAFETKMICPCHGSEFDPSGEVSIGPAESNLKSFVTTHDHENIYINF